MKRRDVLTGVGTVLGTSVIAGCIGGGTGTPDDDTTTTPTTQSPELTVKETVSVDDGDPAPFPENTTPYVVVAANRSDVDRQLHFSITQEGTTIRDWSTTLATREATEIRLVDPADYTVEIRVGDGASTPIEIGDGQFDCNNTQTTATVTDDGVIETQTVSTTAACPAPEIESSSIALTDSDCAGKDAGTATVSTEDGAVLVDGTITAPNPCYGVGLRSVELTEDGLRIVVEPTTPEEQGACMQCVGGLVYEASVSMNNTYPEHVVVEHGDDEETTVITRTDV